MINNSLNIKAVIVPGNGGDKPEDKWFPYVKQELEKKGIKTINQEFPDSILAREKYWFYFLKELKVDKNTILIGHSSGAVAAMRWAENNNILGSVLVSAYDSDLGDEREKQSGYFEEPWNWEAIKKNQKWIIQFASTDDPYFSIDAPRLINKMLSTEYYEFNDHGHFGSEYKEFPELVKAVTNKLV